MSRLLQHLRDRVPPEILGLSLLLVIVVIGFGYASPRFLSAGNFRAVAGQLPELGLLTLAMLLPIISGGLNLAVTYTANICGLTLAWVLVQFGGPDAGPVAFLVGSLAAPRVALLAPRCGR